MDLIPPEKNSLRVDTQSPESDYSGNIYMVQLWGKLIIT